MVYCFLLPVPMKSIKCFEICVLASECSLFGVILLGAVEKVLKLEEISRGSCQLISMRRTSSDLFFVHSDSLVFISNCELKSTVPYKVLPHVSRLAALCLNSFI